MEERKCAMCNHTKAVEEFTDKTKKNVATDAQKDISKDARKTQWYSAKFAIVRLKNGGGQVI